MMAGYRNGVHPRVNTLDKAYDFAANFVESTKANNGNKVIFTAAGSKTGKKYKPKQESNDANKKQEPLQNQRNGGSGTNKKRSSRPGPDFPCKGCGATDHWVKDCPNTISQEVTEAKAASINLCWRTVGAVMTRDTIDEDDIELIPDQRKLFEGMEKFVLIARQQWNSSQITLDSGAGSARR
jgi:hypothetical protein